MIFDFLKTHFLNGHEQPSPRNLLSFLKYVNDLAIDYYEQNPDHTVFLNDNYEYPLYLKKFIYTAYKEIIQEFARTISKSTNKWTKYFGIFLNKRGNKETFDYRWIADKIDEIEEDDIISFLAYLEHIGFLKVKDNHVDIKRRLYELPIIYKRKCL